VTLDPANETSDAAKRDPMMRTALGHKRTRAL
jgi:hypothetical protein